MGKKYTVRQLRTPEEQAIARLADVESRRQMFEGMARTIEMKISAQTAEALFALREPFEQTARAMRALLVEEEKVAEEVKKLHEEVQGQADGQAAVLLEGRRMGRSSAPDQGRRPVWQGKR